MRLDIQSIRIIILIRVDIENIRITIKVKVGNRPRITKNRKSTFTVSIIILIQADIPSILIKQYRHQDIREHHIINRPSEQFNAISLFARKALNSTGY